MHALSVIRYPSGRYGFVGRVPAVLAYEGSEEDMETAAHYGPGIARRIASRNGREFRALSWATREDALAAAAAHGFDVHNG